VSHLPVEKLVLTFVGGCHVAGYLVEKSASFVDHLNGFFAPQLVNRMPYAKIEHLARLIGSSHETEAAFVFLQLGNFEFSASWKQILATTTGLPIRVSNGMSKLEGVPAKPLLPAMPQEPEAIAGTGTNYKFWHQSVLKPAADTVKTLVGASLYVSTWLLLRKHRQQFHALNKLIAQNPQTTFICMSPFPSMSRTHNSLRRLGGWIMQQRLQTRSNLRWVDTHQVLQDKKSLFADGIHLNEYGHQVLAQHLRQVCLTSTV
jgi:hypothetical protein